MSLFLTFVFIFVISFVLAFFSMKDFNFEKKFISFLRKKKIKGSIIFLKDKILHYSSNSSSSKVSGTDEVVSG